MQKTGIKLTSAFTENPIFIEKDEVKIVEGSNENGAKAKVYTRNKGNFYVKEEAPSISEALFDNMVDIQKNL